MAGAEHWPDHLAWPLFSFEEGRWQFLLSAHPKASTRPMAVASSNSRRTTAETNDLALVCQGEERVLVNGARLRMAAHTEAMQEILLKALQEKAPNATGPVELRVPEDKAEHWRVAWAIVCDPLAAVPNSGLTWVR